MSTGRRSNRTFIEDLKMLDDYRKWRELQKEGKAEAFVGHYEDANHRSDVTHVFNRLQKALGSEPFLDKNGALTSSGIAWSAFASTTISNVKLTRHVLEAHVGPLRGFGKDEPPAARRQAGIGMLVEKAKGLNERFGWIGKEVILNPRAIAEGLDESLSERRARIHREAMDRLSSSEVEDEGDDRPLSVVVEIDPKSDAAEPTVGKSGISAVAVLKWMHSSVDEYGVRDEDVQKAFPDLPFDGLEAVILWARNEFGDDWWKVGAEAIRLRFDNGR